MKENGLDWYQLTTGTSHIKTVCLNFSAQNMNLNDGGGGRIKVEITSDSEEFQKRLEKCKPDVECTVELDTYINLTGVADSESGDDSTGTFTINSEYKGIWTVTPDIVAKAIEFEAIKYELISFFVYQLYTNVKRHTENQLELFGVSLNGSGLPANVPVDKEYEKVKTES